VQRRRGFGKDAVKEVFRIWDWQTFDEHDPQILDRVEELLNLKGTRWLNPTTRMNELDDKVYDLLSAVMLKIGWTFPWRYIDHKIGKIIYSYAPIDPKHPKLRMPSSIPDCVFLNLEDNIGWCLANMTLQNRSKEAESESGKIRSGSVLFAKAEDETHQGTIGAIVKDKRSNGQYALTAGHVIGELHSMVAKPANEAETVSSSDDAESEGPADEAETVESSDEEEPVTEGLKLGVPTWALRNVDRPPLLHHYSVA
jgi:hypothetical protein